MRSVSVIPVCVALMVLVFAPAADAETPLGTPLSADQRFEFPEPGIAVSLPDSYLLDRQATPSLPIFESVIAAAPVDGPGECTIETFAFAGQEPNKVAETLGLIADYPEFMIEERYGGLDALPGGDYVLMSGEMRARRRARGKRRLRLPHAHWLCVAVVQHDRVAPRGPLAVHRRDRRVPVC